MPVQAGHIEINDEKLRSFCEKWGIAELAVFGSVLRDDFRPDSDVDFLVTWKAGGRPGSYFELFPIKDELSEIVGRDVDLIERRSAEQIRNPYRRRNILTSASTVYAAA